MTSFVLSDPGMELMMNQITFYALTNTYNHLAIVPWDNLIVVTWNFNVIFVSHFNWSSVYFLYY